jgi:imidazolonepropionase-like amidohydrolase
MATLNAAWSLGRADSVGSLAPSKRCDLLVLASDTLDEMVQHLGGRAIERVVLDGRTVS